MLDINLLRNDLATVAARLATRGVTLDTAAFETVPDGERGDYHLMVGEMVRYKRPELAIQAFNRLGQPLVVIGGGLLARAGSEAQK